MDLGIKKCIAVVILALTANANSQEIELVGRSHDGSAGNEMSFQPSVSSDGRYVAFVSRASNLVSEDGNNHDDIFLRNSQTGELSLVSVNSSGDQSNHSSSEPAVSADGRYIVFGSHASNLVEDDTNGQKDIFLRDAETGLTTRISVSSSGVEGNHYSDSPDISADGRYVVFRSVASNLVDGDNNDHADIFLHDTQLGVTTLLSVTIDGKVDDSYNADPSYFTRDPAISADGRYVVFESIEPNLVINDTNEGRDIFLHDTQTGRNTRVSVTSDGIQNSRGGSSAPAISANGRYIVFASTAPDLVEGDTNYLPPDFGSWEDLVKAAGKSQDIFLHDTQTGLTTRINVSSEGEQSNGGSANPSISANGRYVMFSSGASNLVDDDNNNLSDIFLRDIKKNTTSRISLNSGNQVLSSGYHGALNPVISANARNVVLESNRRLVSDANGSINVYHAKLKIPHASILWRHSRSGRNWLYQFDGGEISKSQGINTISDANWRVVAYADFDGDGQSDIFWRHAASGVNWIYLMDGSRIATSQQVSKVADMRWQVVGADDFNGDGKVDILWRNISTGVNWIYLMDGVNISSSFRLNVVKDLDWEIVGVGDMDGDKDADILWRNAQTGVNGVYLMNGRNYEWRQLNRIPDQNWKVSNLADLDGDGIKDILWRHEGTGHVWSYLMNVGRIGQSKGIAKVSTDWQIATTADFDDDGKEDIFWRNIVTGKNWLYLMNGPSISQSRALNVVKDQGWEAQAAGKAQ